MNESVIKKKKKWERTGRIKRYSIFINIVKVVILYYVRFIFFLDLGNALCS